MFGIEGTKGCFEEYGLNILKKEIRHHVLDYVELFLPKENKKALFDYRLSIIALFGLEIWFRNFINK